MNIERAAGALLLGLPLAFNLFFLLARRFDYPDILRSPTAIAETSGSCVT